MSKAFNTGDIVYVVLAPYYAIRKTSVTGTRNGFISTEGIVGFSSELNVFHSYELAILRSSNLRNSIIKNRLKYLRLLKERFNKYRKLSILDIYKYKMSNSKSALHTLYYKIEKFLRLKI